NCEKVINALKNLVPSLLRDSLKIKINNMSGYYGNDIAILTSRIDDESSILKVLNYISEKLEPIEKNILRITFKLRYDSSKRKFVIRFSKQDLVNEKLKIIDTDDIIKLTIFFRNTRNAKEVETYLAELGILS
ncbi:MAG: RNA-binding domain-containing protein, partial [Desulfurococcaceae archaeon]